MKKEAPVDPFVQYRSALPPEDDARLAALFAAADAHLLLPGADKRGLLRDFENALLYYAKAGVPLPEALSRLDAANLGGFYARPARLWYALDDAAKIYPLSMKQGYMAVFRLSVYLRADVVPELLQMALNFTIKRFQSFATTVKKGFFWHYLNATKRRYFIEPETGVPCRPLKISSSGAQAFRILYCGRRISAEYFHILTDGTGGMVFLKALTAEYLRLCGTAVPCTHGVLDRNGDADAQETANEFSRAEKTENASGFVDRPAAQFGGRLSRTRPCRVIHLKMDAAQLREAARRSGVSVTVYLLAQMFLAGRRATDEVRGEISIQVPVNMRKFYPSDTVRNFALYCGIRLPAAEISRPEDILPEISRQLTQKASKEAMCEMMNSTQRMVGMLPYIPLFIKTPAARLVYGFLGDKIFSSTLSNLGVVTLPPEMAPEIDCMDFVLGTAQSNRASCSMVTVNDTAMLSISKNTADPSFEEALFALLTADGLAPAAEGSGLYEA